MNDYRVSVGLQLSGWEWSNTQGESTRIALLFDFSKGERVTGSLNQKYSFTRALCVRRSGE
jgi:hypothetical protein